MTTVPQPGPTADPTAQDRLKWMGKNSSRLIIALVVLIIAGLVVAFSFGLFSTSSANPGNMVTSGIMEQSNSNDGEAILTVEDLVPGESGEGTVSITNVGDADGDFTLTASNLADTKGGFSDLLTLVILDGSTEVYNAPLSGITSVDLGTWAADEAHDFTFTVTFDEAAGNEFQDATSTVDFTWDALQSTS